MSCIVCGTDFSPGAAQAARAAAVLAQRLGEPLKLVHVIDELGAELSVDTPLHDHARAQLKQHASQLAKQFAIKVEPVALAGHTSRMLIDVAEANQARLLVVSSLGKGKEHGWLLGSTAERVAQASSVPVLVVRDSGRIEAWVRGETALRVMVAVELAPSSRAALRWAAELRKIGPCDLHVVQVVSSRVEQLSASYVSLAADPSSPCITLREALARDLRAWAGELPGSGENELAVSLSSLGVGAHLTNLAAEWHADLVVLGIRRQSPTERLWSGSVRRGTLGRVSCSVASVPCGKTCSDLASIPTYRRVLIATDFSPLGNCAVPVGFGLLHAGGVVHLLHVISADKKRALGLASAETSEAEVRARLRALVPVGAASLGVSAELEVVRDESASAGIWRSAERLGADAICMATHGRSGIKAVLGSKAQEVVARAKQPVMLVPPHWPEIPDR